jgi:hypothetical protein
LNRWASVSRATHQRRIGWVIDFQLNRRVHPYISQISPKYRNFLWFLRFKAGTAVALKDCVGRLRGPASRSGVPLGHPPSNISCLAAGRVEKTSLPRHVR